MTTSISSDDAISISPIHEGHCRGDRPARYADRFIYKGPGLETVALASQLAIKYTLSFAMSSFRKLLASTVLAISFVSSAAALSTADRHATRRSVSIGSDLVIEAYHPPSTFETFNTGVDHPLSKRAVFSLSDAAMAFTGSRLAKNASDMVFRSGFSSGLAEHAYLSQIHDGIPFANAVANVAFNKDSKVTSFGSSFVEFTSVAPSTPSIELSAAIPMAEQALNGKFNEHPASLEYFAKADGTAVLTHVIQVENEELGTFFEAFVDAHSGELVSVTDFVSKASYLVVPMDRETLEQGFETLVDPQDIEASPVGWHNTGTANTTTTSGNNALVFKTSASFTSSQTSDELNFEYVQDPSAAPTVQVNVDAARVNAFYVVNSIHDLTYRYGFTEAAFNFQVNNFGKGGRGNDQVQVSVQDSSGTNNANFATPGDGQPGRMRMYLWTMTTPGRDGALENDIVIHEMTHGVTNRMTGGGTGRCLQTAEAGGMGEGWSDAMADWNEKTSSEVPDYVLGQYVTNRPGGIRSAPYSTNASVNSLRYSSLQIRTQVHAIGEVWANMLHNVYANLVDALGWSATARTDPTGTEGNVVFLHLFLDALTIQPCNPTFITARDAWIQADVDRYQGANACLIWKAFASRGLGVGAANHVDNTEVPAECA
ncbi:unnamed protein product [Cyclocybe aegerita]|uniref:Extracellular metalloproteinase n=1 Tax=Cyclocybe aegerita TaxID=1973307 RepID=A0A8S0VVV6_CYCAE|nr:unnamed protein product [Cyclocybe aegerita]